MGKDMKPLSGGSKEKMDQIAAELDGLSDDPEFRISHESEPRVCDIVFAGGGAKGIAHLGAIWAFNRLGIKFKRLAGTSAGAINAALVAAGFDCEELMDRLMNMDFISLRDGFWDKRLPKIARIAAISTSYGMYEGERLQVWIEELLAEKNAHTFGRLPMKKAGMLADLEQADAPRLSIMASDITYATELLMPRDLVLDRYGNIRSTAFPVSAAVRMSISVPFFFTPYKLHDSLIVDGAFASNLPLEVFDRDDPADVRWPTFGLNLDSGGVPQNDTTDLFHFGLAIFDTMRYGQSRMSFLEYPTRICRLIDIYTEDVRTLDFGITREQKERLFLNGARSVLETLSGKEGKGIRRTWNFDQYMELRRRWGFPPIDKPYLED